MGFGFWDFFPHAVVVLCVLAPAACGKKGPPQVPFVRIPAAAEISGARRTGDEVFVTVKVPNANVDASMPASLREIEIYGVTSTSTPPTGAPFLSIATLVATIPVARDADPADTSGTVVPDPATGALQGTTVIVRDVIDAADMVPRTLPAAAPTPTAPTTAAPSTSSPPEAPRRFYMAVTYAGGRASGERRPGPPSAVAALPFTALPDRVQALSTSMTGRQIVVSWEPSGGLLGWLLERSLPPEIAPIDTASAEPAAASGAPASAPAADLPAGPTLYNVYRDISPNPLALPEPGPGPAAWNVVPATPVNMAPLTMLTFTEEVPYDDRLRCYHVRAVRGSGAQAVESGASERQCIQAVDFEPPDAPTELIATASEGVITLSWDPNGEEDLRGYVVLRREAADDTLLTLTERGPIRETRYEDRAVTAGRAYVYIVRAVDTRLPLGNLSEPTTVTETAR